jgi:hypothetical protein
VPAHQLAAVQRGGHRAQRRPAPGQVECDNHDATMDLTPPGGHRQAG